jgi:hypothetical protein
MTASRLGQRSVPQAADVIVSEGELLPTALSSTGRAINGVPTRRLDLKTLSHVRKEQALVYRLVRSGEVSTSDGSRLVYMLGQLARTILDAELEQRLRRLEAINGE